MFSITMYIVVFLHDCVIYDSLMVACYKCDKLGGAADQINRAAHSGEVWLVGLIYLYALV